MTNEPEAEKAGRTDHALRDEGGTKRARRDPAPRDPCIRAENEDDDGYDPYSDRRPEPEPLFERDPWG